MSFLSFDARIVFYIGFQVHIMKFELVSGLEINDLWSTIFGLYTGAVILDTRLAGL